MFSLFKMIEKIYFLFLFCAITIKAQPYCTYGPDVFPWSPYRCPPFLMNRTTEQRDEYFAIANNCTAPISELKKAMVDWGTRYGEGKAVENYIRNVTLLMDSVANSVKSELGQFHILEDIGKMMTNDSLTQNMRNGMIMYVLHISAVVNAWNNYGSSSPFKNMESGQFNNSFNSNPGYGQPNQQSNQMGSYLKNAIQLQMPCLENTKFRR